MDWRNIPSNELQVEEFELPPEIKEKCIVFMKEMGLLFGCFDFIVTPDGEYYFLEINEQGQFLWVEDRNPNIKMLDSFVRFLVDPLKVGLSCPVSLKEFDEEIAKMAVEGNIS
jgi:glutathione synthase/RimK-type ligase-like ATP-grasp enzyme